MWDTCLIIKWQSYSQLSLCHIFVVFDGNGRQTFISPGRRTSTTKPVQAEGKFVHSFPLIFQANVCAVMVPFGLAVEVETGLPFRGFEVPGSVDMTFAGASEQVSSHRPHVLAIVFRQPSVSRPVD